MNFVSDSGDYCVSMVDNLLDILTGTEHSKTTKILEQVASFYGHVYPAIKY